MITFQSYPTLEKIKSTFNLNTGILEVTDENKLNFCRHEDDAVIVQIGWVTNTGFDVDTALTAKAAEVHSKLNSYLEGGCHGGITMVVLSLDSENKGYNVFGDDTDNECEPVQVESDSVTGLINDIDKLV